MLRFIIHISCLILTLNSGRFFFRLCCCFCLNRWCSLRWFAWISYIVSHKPLNRHSSFTTDASLNDKSHFVALDQIAFDSNWLRCLRYVNGRNPLWTECMPLSTTATWTDERKETEYKHRLTNLQYVFSLSLSSSPIDINQQLNYRFVASTTLSWVMTNVCSFRVFLFIANHWWKIHGIENTFPIRIKWQTIFYSTQRTANSEWNKIRILFPH